MQIADVDNLMSYAQAVHRSKAQMENVPLGSLI